MLRAPAPAAWRSASPPVPPTVCSWVHTHTHAHIHKLVISFLSPLSPANTLASRHWYWCQYSEGRVADCPVSDLHVLSFDVFRLASFCSFLLYIYSNKIMQQYSFIPFSLHRIEVPRLFLGQEAGQLSGY